MLIIANINWTGFISAMVVDVVFTYKSLHLKSSKIFLEKCNDKNVFNLFKLNSLYECSLNLALLMHQVPWNLALVWLQEVP